MSGKAKTTLKKNKSDLGPNDHGYRHEKPKTVKVLEFRVNARGNLSPKYHFERADDAS